MSHDLKTIELGWAVEEHSPSVSGLTVTPGATSGQSRVAANVEFTDSDPIVLHFEGLNATAPLFGWLDFTIANNSGVAWDQFNISTIDTFVEPPTSSFPPMAVHPFHSHFHDINLTGNPAANPVFSGPSQFSRLGYTTILDRPETVAPNSWELTGGTFGGGTTEQWTNFRFHQWEFANRTVNGSSVFSGGSFDVILTPNASHVDYNGYVVTEDEQNTNSLTGDAPHFGNPISRKDMLFGYEGADALSGLTLDDKLYGGAGNDTLNGGDDNDELSGGADNDVLRGERGNDTVKGGAGSEDVAQFSGTRSDYNIEETSPGTYSVLDLRFGANTDGRDTVNGVEFFEFADGRIPVVPAVPDVRVGTDADDTFISSGAAAIFSGGGGNDTLTGADLADVLSGGSGDDSIAGAGGNDFLDGGRGDDNINTGTGDDGVLAGSGDDTIGGMAGRDTIEAGAGNDLVAWNDPTGDLVFGGRGHDTLRGGDVAADTIHGGSGNDLIRAVANQGLATHAADLLFGDRGDDAILGGNANDTIEGGAGDDTLAGFGGADTFVFRFDAPGDDTINDFDTTADVVQLIGFDAGFDPLANLSDTTSGAVLDLGDAGEVLFFGRLANEFSAGSFIL
jgi:Ca2+-binding RTX toxin-like protein